MSDKSGVSILGIFVADTAYFAKRMPEIGETLIGSDFDVGPGGKGSNQSVAAARAGAKTFFISKIGNDTFGQLAINTYESVGVVKELTISDDMPTGAAFIFVNEESGENAIIVYPGAAGTISVADVQAKRAVIENSKVFVTQLEQPAEAALAGLKIAREAGVMTIFNPAPAERFPEKIYPLCDFIIPNETEAGDLVGFTVASIEDARKAAKVLRDRGAKTAVITLGDKGVYIQNNDLDVHVPVISDGAVVDTAGAGDAFIGGFSAALAEGKHIVVAAKYGCATAGIAVTRSGTARAMPKQDDILALLSRVGS